jgi:Zn-dependent protease
MLLLGIGWAKPVPVNPRNFRGNYRKCDLLVSIAGVAMNLIMFLIGCIAMYIFIAAALAMIPVEAGLYAAEGFFRTSVEGVPVLVDGRYYYHLSELLRYGTGLSDLLIVPVFGQNAGYLYEMLYYLMATNLMLAVFNLIPVPPLDGYHVLNDLVLKRPLFADFKAQRIGMGIMYMLMFTGYLSEGLGWISDQVFAGVSTVFMAVFRGIGLF